MINMNFVVGNDNGNSEHDIIINDYVITQPNCYSRVRKLPMLDEVNPEYVAKNIEDNLIVSINSPSCSPGIYFIGNYALNAGEKVRSIEVGVDNNKVDSELVIINTLAQIAGHAVKKQYESSQNLKEEITVKIDMTTALPIQQYSKNNARKFAEKFLGNSHSVIVHVATNPVNVKLTFEYVAVLPEGVTAVHALQNEEGEIYKNFNLKYKKNINREYFKNKKILHISIGEGTTEYPVTSDIMFDPNFIQGSNNGIGHSIDKSLGEFKREIGLLSYSRQKYSEVLKNKSHKYNEIATDIISDYIEEEGEEILHYAKTEIQRANNEIDIIAVYGGGSISMRSMLEPKLEDIVNKAGIELLYVEENFATILEVRGMFEFTKSKIFKMLKHKYLEKIKNAN